MPCNTALAQVSYTADLQEIHAKLCGWISLRQAKVEDLIQAFAGMLVAGDISQYVDDVR